VLLINALDEDASGSLSVAAKRIGGPLLFGRIWERLGIGNVLGELLRDRAFEFAVERAVFVGTLHRLFVSGSDRDCAVWMEDYEITGVEDLELHHFYRAMAWLGEELEEVAQGALAPRCVKDVIEERLFDRRRDLFSDLSAVFMDTTSLSFYGEGGETLGEHGYSKDHRPDLRQMILGLVVDGSGTPICTEMWPGNTADVTALLPVIDRLRARFGIGRVCVVADRGMISAETIAGLEARRLEYILGARERSDAVLKKIVLADQGPFVPLLIERRSGETQLFVKEVNVGGKRFVVCRNEAEAEKDRADREAIIAALDRQLKRGDKALIGNSAYRRYLRKTTDSKNKAVFEIDPGKLAEEARFDGIFVLRTNANVTPLQAVLRYRELIKVENLFLRTKSLSGKITLDCRASGA
jgi:Transposase DDE domain